MGIMKSCQRVIKYLVHLKRVTALCSVAVAAIVTAATAQWQQAAGPVGGMVWQLGGNSTSLFAGTHSGLYRSDDNGNTWELSCEGLTGQHNRQFPDVISVFCIDDSMLLASPRYGGIFRSVDNGLHWVRVDSAELGAISINCFYAVQGIIYAATSGHSIYYSTDNGLSWTQVVTDLKYLDGITALDGILFVASTDTEMLRSTDKGATWTKIVNPGYRIRSLAVLEGILYSGSERNGIHYSADSGETWREINKGLPVLSNGILRSISALCGFGGVMFAGDEAGNIVRWNSGDSTWVQSDSGLPQPHGAPRISSFLSRGDTLFVSTWGDGVFASVDTGRQWHTHNEGLVNTAVIRMASKGRRIFAGTERSGLFSSVDQGMSWTRIDTGLQKRTTFSRFHSFALCNERLLVGSSDNGIIYRDDGDESWSFSEEKDVVADGLLVAQGDTAYRVAASSLVYMTHDGGTTWVRADSGLHYKLDCSSLAIHNGNVFSGTDSGGVFRSSLGSGIWSPAGSGLPEKIPVMALLSTPHSLFAGTQNSMFRSMDNGATWQEVISGLPAKPVNTLFLSGGWIFAGVHDTGVFVSTDNGTTWSDFSTGLPFGVKITSFAECDEVLFAGIYPQNGRGGACAVWKRPLQDLAVPVRSAPAAVLSGVKKLEFLSGVKVSRVTFSVPHAERVVLKMSTLSGREVATLADRRFSAGTHYIVWNTSAASGCYLLSLCADSFTACIPVVLHR